MKFKLKLLIGSLLLALANSMAHAAPVIRAFTPASLERIVTEHKGKPFVLVVWSLDCSFCQATLDNLADERRWRKDLRIVTLSTDPAGDQEAMAQAVKRLQALGLADHAWAFGDAPPEQLRYALDARWHGEKPRTYWFNAKGERTSYSGLVTPALIDRFMPRQ